MALARASTGTKLGSLVLQPTRKIAVKTIKAWAKGERGEAEVDLMRGDYTKRSSFDCTHAHLVARNAFSSSGDGAAPRSVAV